MNRRMVLAMALLAGAGLQAGLPDYPILRAAVPVTVDGEVRSDPAWRCAPQVTGFSVLGGGYTKAKQTSVQMLWDERGLCVAVVCEEPDAALLKPSARDYGETWAEDSLEIFLQPAQQVYQIGVTAGGARGSGEGGPEAARITAAAKTAVDSYSIEVLIPAAVLKAAPKSGDQWRGAVCRNIFTVRSGGDKFTSWPALQSRFLEPEHFAGLAFSAETGSADTATAITERLNAAYRQTMGEQVQAAAAQGEQYRLALREAGTDAAFGDAARKLLDEWGRIEASGKASGLAGTTDMRASLNRLQALNEQSYRLQYTYLISKLLREN